MSNILQNINKAIKSLNKRIDIIQNVGGGVKINTTQISFNTLIGEKTKTLYIRLGKKPEPEWRLKTKKTTIQQTKPVNFEEGNKITITGNTAKKTIGYINDDSKFVFEEYELERSVGREGIRITIESPNPRLIEINPTELIFTEENWDKDQEVQLILTDRIRYATEYYDRVKIISELEGGGAYLEEYIDINIYSSNQREGYAKGREIDSLESYRHPVNYSEEKKIRIEKFQIIGSIVGGHYTSYPTVEFNGKYYNKKDPNVLQIIAQLAGTTPDLIIMPEYIPEYATPSSPPLEPTHYAILGIDGRIFKENGDPEIKKHISKFPKRIKISISDKIFYEYELSDFSTVSSPPPVNSQSNFGPLDRGIIEISVDEEFKATELIKLMPNGDSAFYIYAILEGEDEKFLDIQSWCNKGFLLYRPFVLKPIISHTKNIWDTNRGIITHTFVQRYDANFIQYLDSYNKFDKRSGFTVFNKDYYDPELYYKFFYNTNTMKFNKVFFKGLVYDEQNVSELANLIDPNVDIKPYYTSLDAQYPNTTNKWIMHSETPFVRVDYQSNTGYIFLKNQQGSIRKFSSPIDKPFYFDDTSLKEDPLVRCNTEIISRNKLQIIDFA